MGKIAFLLHSGKNRKFPYYFRNYLRYLWPAAFCRRALPSLLAEMASRSDAAYIRQRIDYYNRLVPGARCSDTPRRVGDFRLRGASRRRCKSVYFFDVYEYLRYFPSSFRWEYCPGDVIHVPPFPSIVKSRPLTDDNACSVVMKIDKVRHFVFVRDKIPFEQKQDKLLFRGKVAGKACRETFMRLFYGHPMCDAGDVGRGGNLPPEWHRPKMTIGEQLRYKFILALEGNDVASNLKWIMSSGSVAVMPRPTCETWFMEGTLVPGEHYIEIKPDFSDLEEQLRYYMAHPEEVKRIIANAHRYVDAFRDRRREELISIGVLYKYFVATRQI